MKNFIFCLSLVGIITLAISCNPVEVGPNELDIRSTSYIDQISFDYMSLIEDAAKNRGNQSTSHITTDNQEVMEIVGTSRINRNNSGFNVTFQASDTPNLDPAGHAVTLWALAYEFVITEEGPTFVFRSMYRAGGHVIGGSGNVNFGAHISEGQTDDLVDGVPLMDAQNNIIVCIAKSHGLADPAIMPGQIQSFGVGCEEDPDGAGPMEPCYEFIGTVHFPG